MYKDYIYDIETYPNLFTLSVISAATGDMWQHEISERRNQVGQILQFLWFLAQAPGVRMVGFNNEGFDYPIIHHMMQIGQMVTAGDAYYKCQQIINRSDDDRFSGVIWEDDRFIEQVDLFKIHHFDNRAKSTSLKALEFSMRSESIEDLPFSPGTMIPLDGIDTVLTYNLHDVTETLKFYNHSLPMIRFREELSERYGRNFINFNDTKIGKEYLIMKLEEAGVQCYDRSSGRREPRQTIRHSIHLGNVILPYIRFDNLEFSRVKDWIAAQIITETKGVFDNVTATVNGFQFVFGLGGIHGSIDNAIIEATDTHAIIDLDVTSYYPSMAIVNNLHPEHLGSEFCPIYGRLKSERVQHPKGSAPNAMLKLGLNGVYGDSNNTYSVFYDPKFTMAITINGQLSLCMLSERLMTIPGLRMIQANTDGVTVYLPREHTQALEAIRKEWEAITGLELEEARYSRMMIRDVNNYIAEYENGKIKRKGAYEYDVEWHQDASALVVIKAAESALLDGENIRNYIMTHPDPLDFMLRAKVPHNTQLMIGDKPQQRITRYYISNNGQPMFKVMPPVKGKELIEVSVYQMPDGREVEARTKTEIKKVEKKGRYIGQRIIDASERRQDINKGWLVTECNDLRRAVHPFDFNYEWYINEAEKLVNNLTRRFTE